MRRDELLALRFSAVDWFAKELRIRRSVSKARGTDGAHKWEWRDGPPKSKRSVRRIGLTESALAVISVLACDPWSNRLFSISAWGRKTEASLVGLRRVTVCSIRRQPVARLKRAPPLNHLLTPEPRN